MSTDSDTWARILKGDHDAWAKLVKQYEALVYTVAIRTGLSYSLSADCFQQTWVILFEKRKSIKNPSQISSWLVTTAKREAWRLLSISRKEGTDELLPFLEDKNALPDSKIEKLETEFMIQESIGQIDHRCQTLLKLLFYSPVTYSYKEITSKLGISVNALGAARKRCLERLRKILEKNNHFDAFF